MGPQLAGFGAVFMLVVACFVFFSSSPSIVVSPKYFVFGAKTFLYENIESIVIDEKKMTCTVKSRHGNAILIRAQKFTTDARKEWKIENNKHEKFYKVVTKIVGYAKSENPRIGLKVDNADRFKNNAAAADV
jgi:hypothetical protein